jgi:ubiquinone/menaquinone biosynthesis C-methylase UbiE
VATVFMRWLERKPSDYDRGIGLITLGQLPRLQRTLVGEFISEGLRVLEIGCGTGKLTQAMVGAGALVTAVDRSEPMLHSARDRMGSESADRVQFLLAEAATLTDHFEPFSFDRVVISLALSEMEPRLQDRVLRSAHSLLRGDGALLIIDETRPQGTGARLLYALIRYPLQLVTWLLTRTTTRPLDGLEGHLAERGFEVQVEGAGLMDSLKLWRARPRAESAEELGIPVVVGEIRHETNARTILLDLWAAFFRIIPPYPRWKPGLYRLGLPDRGSPVLVTGNFDLTLRRVARALDGKLDAWVLVANSNGVNVWCAAGGGFLTAERIAAALSMSGLEGYLHQHALILPQLSANGVDGWRLRKQTGWGVHWGPVRIEDLPEYLESGRKKSPAMRWVSFPLGDRLEMMAATLGFYSLLILLPVAVFWRTQFLAVAAALLGLSAFYAVFLPWIPGRDGLEKSLPLGVLALLGMLVYSRLWDPVGPLALFNRALGMVALSVFVGAELQGMSPKMRGEQANWKWEALIALVLGGVYWLLPAAVGWR